MTDRTRGRPAGAVPQANGEEHAAQLRRTRAEERIAELDASPAQLAAHVEDLRAQLEEAQREAQEMRSNWQRSAADYANYRRRTEQDRMATLGLANEALLSKLLVIVDDFDRAIANMPPELASMSWVEGVVAIDRKLRQLLESEGLTPIEAEGRPFDPREHEAVVREETSTVPEGTITAELQRGYRIRDRVLRPAMVAVAAQPTNEETTTETTNNERLTNEFGAGNGDTGGKD